MLHQDAPPETLSCQAFLIFGSTIAMILSKFASRVHQFGFERNSLGRLSALMSANVEKNRAANTAAGKGRFRKCKHLKELKT